MHILVKNFQFEQIFMSVLNIFRANYFNQTTLLIKPWKLNGRKWLLIMTNQSGVHSLETDNGKLSLEVFYLKESFILLSIYVKRDQMSQCFDEFDWRITKILPTLLSLPFNSWSFLERMDYISLFTIKSSTFVYINIILTTPKILSKIAPGAKSVKKCHQKEQI